MANFPLIGKEDFENRIGILYCGEIDDYNYVIVISVAIRKMSIVVRLIRSLLVKAFVSMGNATFRLTVMNANSDVVCSEVEKSLEAIV